MLYKYHSKSFKELKRVFYENEKGFIGMDALLEDYGNVSPICLQFSRANHRLDSISSFINAEGPYFSINMIVNFNST